MDVETGNKLYKRIQDRYAAMRKIRLPFEPSWKEIIQLGRPDLALWDDEGQDKQGKKRNLTVYNATAQHDMLIWRDGLLGQIATQSLDWFYYTWPDKKLNESRGVKEWLRESVDAVALAMRESNYYSHLGSVVWDGGSFGNAPAWIEANSKGNGIRCETFHPREIWVQENAEGMIDGFIHGSFEMTAKDAADKFGKENLSDALQNCLKDEKNPLEMFKFTEATFQINDPIFKGISGLPTKREWIKVAIEDMTQPDRKKPLSLEGYFSKPFTYWRMFDTPGSVYSLGLMGFALVDIFGLNAITRSMLRAANIAVEPPFYVHADMRGRLNIEPRGKTYGTKPEHMPQRIEVGNYPFGDDREDRATQAIHRWFDVDFFLMLSNVDKVYTATQVMQMRNERAILLSPKVGRFQFDKLNQDHERIFDILYRQDKISPPPQILLENAEAQFDVQYNGLLDRAQKQYRQIEQLELALSQLGPVFQISPEQRFRVKWDKLTKRILQESEAINEDEIASDEEFQGIIAQIQQQQQAMAQLQIMNEAAKTIPSLQKEMAPTSPLARLAQAGGAA